MSDSDNKVIEVINHYQDALNRYVSRGEEHKILHCLDKLRRLPITVSHLEETGVGRSVNSLRKVEGEVGDGARRLVNQWKEMVEQDTHHDSDNEDVEDTELDIEENSSPIHDHTSNVDSKNDKKLTNKHEQHESSGKSNRHAKEKDKSEKKYSESSSKGQNNTSSSSHKSHSDSFKRKHEEADVSKHVKDDSDNSDEFDDRKKKQKHCRESPKSKKHKDSEYGSNKNKDKYSEKTERIKDKDKKDKHLETSPKLKQNGHSHKKESIKDKKGSGSKSTKYDLNSNSGIREEKRKEEKVKESTHLIKEDKNTCAKIGGNRNIKEKLKNVDSIDSGSGASFAEALGMLEPPPKIKSIKKKSVNKIDVKNSGNLNLEPSTSGLSNSKQNLPSHSSIGEKYVAKEESRFVSEMENIGDDLDDYLSDDNDMELNDIPALLTNPPKLDPLEINISSLLPAITPNYRPVANNPLLNENPRHKILTDYENLSNVISSKNARTKVYSGNKMSFGKIPSLFELCTRILMDNIDALEYTGGVPYMILKPVLDKCTPDQLLMLEHFNPYLIEDTDSLWNFHCQKEFRNKKREEWESWREMYTRCVDEREAKLRALTANIKQSLDKSVPVRQTKLAYVDSVVKPPRSIAKKQQRNGYIPDAKSPLITPSSRLSTIAQSGSAGQVLVPNPSHRAAIGASSSAIIKIKKAPLMQKTLQLMKGRFRR